MVQTRDWKRSEHGLSIPIAPQASGLYPIASVHSPAVTDVSLLRYRSYPRMSFVVGTASSDVPPPEWWVNSSVQVTTAFSASGADVYLVPNSNDERMIATVSLMPTLVAAPWDPTAYYVNWTYQGGVVESFAKRKGDPAHDSRVCTQFRFVDPDSAYNTSFYTAIDAVIWIYEEALWGYAP